jgi:predicted dehydrogenase
MTSAKYRAAVIGCGKMSRGHSHAYANSSRVDLVAGADVFAGARDAFATEFGVRNTYEDPADMLEREKPDLVSVCTWPPLHADLTIAAFAAGAKAVWCEKPMAVHMADVDRMVDAARDAGAVLVINHQRRYFDRFNRARDLADAGAIGEVTQITGICGGDTLTDGTHLIDMTRYLNHDTPITKVFGAIEMSPMGDVNPNGMGTIEFNTTRLRYGHHIETGALGVLFFENGVRGHLEIGSLSRGGYQRFTIDGTDGRIEISGDAAFDDGSNLKILRRNGEYEKITAEPGEKSMEGVLADMLVSIETGASHRMSGDSGRADFEVITALFESARERKTINLPIDIPQSPLEEMLAAGEIPLN